MYKLMLPLKGEGYRNSTTICRPIVVIEQLCQRKETWKYLSDRKNSQNDQRREGERKAEREREESITAME